MLSGESKIIVVGASGMLAQDLIARLKEYKCSLSLLDIREGTSCGLPVKSIDITNESSLTTLIYESKPDIVINCAAYTKVDDAEKEQEAAYRINALGAAKLASAIRRLDDRDTVLVHYSTDYVFGGEDREEVSNKGNRPISEGDVTCPVNVYGQSKRLGDEFVSRILPEQHLILRTSWLHGVSGPNFIDTMLRVGKSQKQVKVVNDQTGSPTWTGWLAEVTTSLLEKEQRGLFNATCAGGITWGEYASR